MSTSRRQSLVVAAVILAALTVPSCTPAKTAALTKWEREHQHASPFIRTRPVWPAEWDNEDNNVPVESSETRNWKTAFRTKLREPISFDFADAPLDHVTAFMLSIKLVSILVDARAILDTNEDIKVTLLMENVPFGEALEHILKPHGLGYTLANGAIFITTREELAEWLKLPTVGYDEAEWEPVEAAMNTPVSGEFIRTPFDDVITFLRDRAKLNIVQAAHFPKSTNWISLKFRNMKAKFVLAWVCHEFDLAYTVKSGVILITTPEAVRDKSSRRIGVAFARPKPIWPAEWGRERNRIPVGGPPRIWWREAFEKRLAEPVSFELINTPLYDVVAFLISLKQVSVVVDAKGIEQRGALDVTLRVDKVAYCRALDWVLRLEDLGYAVTDGAVYVTSRERLAAWEKAPTAAYDAREWQPVEAAMNKPISFDFKSVSFDDFITFLRARTKLKISRAAAARPRKIDRIALKVKDMKVKIALAWACHQLDLAYTVKDGVVLITTPDRIAAMMKPSEK